MGLKPPSSDADTLVGFSRAPTHQLAAGGHVEFRFTHQMR